MPRGRVLRTASLLGLALAGMVPGHALTYAGLSPRAVVREAWLTSTGHGYLPIAGRLGLAAAILALGVAFLREFQAPGSRAPRRLTGRLVIYQMVGFLAVECTERIASGSGFGDLVQVLPIGLAIQAGVAVLLAAAIGYLVRAASVAATRTSHRLLPRRAPFPVPLSFRTRTSGRFPPAVLGARAPPSVR